MEKLEKLKELLSARNFALFVLIVKMFQIPLLWIWKPTIILFSIFPYICVAWFLIILSIDFFGERNLIKNTGIFWIILFLISYVITSCLNYKYNFADNIQLVFWMAIQYIVIFGCERGRDFSYNKRTIELAAKVFSFITIAMMLISLLFFFIGIGGEVMVAGNAMRFGLRNNRLFGVFASPNYASLFSVITIVALFYMFSNAKRVLSKAAYILLMLLAYFYLTLTVSNTGKIAFLIAFTLLCFGVFYSRILAKFKRKILLSILSSVIIAVIAVIPFSNIQNTAASAAKITNSTNIAQHLKTVTEKTIGSISANSNSDNTDTNSNVISFNEIDEEEISFDRNDFSSELSLGRRLTHDRLPIWQDAIKLLLPRNPAFGVSALGYMSRINEEYPESFISQYNKYSMHNDFVTLLACCGIVGAAIMLVFMFIIIKKIFRYLIDNKDSIYELKKIWYPLIVIIVCAASMIYSDAVLVNTTIESTAFWICLGYIVSIVDPNPKSNIFLRIIDNILLKFQHNKGK